MVQFKYSKDYIVNDLLFIVSENNYFREEQLRQLQEHYPDLYCNLMETSEDLYESVIIDFIKHMDNCIVQDIEKHVSNLNNLWCKRGNRIVKRLNVILNISWDKNCIGYVGILPIYPRELDSRSFGLFYKDDLEESLGIAVHEITHFIYFDKWRELFPNDEDRFFEAPHGVWHLSEIMAPVLNNDKEIKKLVPSAVNESEYMDKQYKQKKVSVHKYFKDLYYAQSSIESFFGKARRMVTTDNNIF